MMRDDRQEYACGALRACSALFPISKRCWGEAKASGELRLAEAEISADGLNVDSRGSADFHHRHANRYIVPAGPRDGFFHAPDESAASSGMFRPGLFGACHN